MTNRRQFIKASGLLALAGSAPAFFQHALAATWPAAFGEKQLDSAVKSYFGNAYQQSDAITFDAPEIAENGSVVPVGVNYDGAVEKIAIFVEENPQPLAAAFDLTPKSVAGVATRIKMGKSSVVHAVVKTADGKVLGTAKTVKVTIGGCGG